MTEVEQFVARALAYCERADLAPSTVSRKLLGNGKRLTELASGKSLRVDTLVKAKRTLSEMERAA